MLFLLLVEVKRLGRKILIVLMVTVLLSMLSSLTAQAQDIGRIENSIDELYNSLSETVRQDLKTIGAENADLLSLNDVSFQKVMSLIMSKFSNESKGTFASSAVVMSILLLNAFLSGFRDSLKQSSMQEVLSIISTLCITTSLVIPVMDLINTTVNTIRDASDFMLLYIPVMVALLTFTGQAVTGASYYSSMVLACQGVSQLSTKIISPLLSVYLSFCVSSSITNRVNLKGFCDMFSKVIKWLVSFAMTIFSALMTIKSMITTAYDSVTARAVRFTMSSFIPIVGAALSESYKTIQGSINLLRSGAGVFVILAICVVFLPCILRCFVWLISVNFCKSIAQVIGITSPVELLSSVSSVISTVFAISVCVMAMFIISTALLITIGGGAT